MGEGGSQFYEDIWKILLKYTKTLTSDTNWSTSSSSWNLVLSLTFPLLLTCKQTHCQDLVSSIFIGWSKSSLGHEVKSSHDMTGFNECLVFDATFKKCEFEPGSWWGVLDTKW
jgi:hypothetical protein